MITFASCTEHGVFQRYHHFEDGNWKKGETINFEVEITDTTSKYGINYLVRHTVEYAYQNLWIEGNIIYPDSQVIPFKQSLTLGNAQGYWYGNGISDIMNVEVPVQENAIFPQAGKYRFEIKHIMRVDPIENIMDLGLKLKKNN